MKAFKGFNRDMTCRGFQYEEGGKYETDKAKVCDTGFHACENPLDCLTYYKLNDSVYHEVEMGGEIDKRRDGDSKIASTKITIGAKLSIAGIVKGAIDFVMSKVKATAGYAVHAATAGDAAHAVTAGDEARAATAGDEAHAATAGYAAHAATAGRFANAATAGDEAHAEVQDCDAMAVVCGRNCKAKGGVGSWLVLTERDNERHILGVKAIKIDGKKYKSDTWYTLRGGEVVEANDGGAE